jgi:hypothetical protein
VRDERFCHRVNRERPVRLRRTICGCGAEIDQGSQELANADHSQHQSSSRNRKPAPHPEEMKATLDLAIGNAVSVKASVRTTPAGLIAAAMLAAPILLPTVALAKTLLRERRDR